MSIISPNVKMLMKSIMVSENAIVGSVKGAESTIRGDEMDAPSKRRQCAKLM
jgi:hypothetical protein